MSLADWVSSESSLGPHHGGSGDPEFDSLSYWEERYKAGGTSGTGSYGELAAFKAEVVNDFIRSHSLRSVIEFGCGDGNQLAMIDYPEYLGLDISTTAVSMCREKFKGVAGRRFTVYDPSTFDQAQPPPADLVVCLDVLYHVIEEADYVLILNHIFMSAKKYVILYTNEDDIGDRDPHLFTRDTLSYLARYPSFVVSEIIPQRYPELSFAEFFLLERDLVGPQSARI